MAVKNGTVCSGRSATQVARRARARLRPAHNPYGYLPSAARAMHGHGVHIRPRPAQEPTPCEGAHALRRRHDPPLARHGPCASLARPMCIACTAHVHRLHGTAHAHRPSVDRMLGLDCAPSDRPVCVGTQRVPALSVCRLSACVGSQRVPALSVCRLSACVGSQRVSALIACRCHLNACRSHFSVCRSQRVSGLTASKQTGPQCADSAARRER